MKRKLLRAAALFLTVLLLLQTAAFADAAPQITHTAKATVALKVRAEANSSSKGVGSVGRGDTVSVTELGTDWCKVWTGRNEGWVQAKYLTDITPVAGYTAPEQDAKPVATPAPKADPEPGFTMDVNTYEDKFVSCALYKATVYAKPDTASQAVGSLKKYEELYVGQNSNGWSLIRYQENKYGYVLTDKLFRWDRVDPFAGEIPGQDLCASLVWVGHSTHLYNAATNEDDKTINPGSCISVYGPDGNGHYTLPYERWTDYISESDTVWKIDVVPWEDAQPGDLISCMTTYFGVGIHTLWYQGRNWNIHLGAQFITGTVVQPGEEYNQYTVMGPYVKATGYHEAPINSPNARSGFGGGTCQVNTTFYIATIVLPMLIKHRQVHQNLGMHYCKIGFDSAVGGGPINLIMVNTLPYAIRYQYMISDGVLTCAIFRN